MKDLLFHHPIQRDRERGQSLVEFVLVLPILLLVIAGTLEIANYIRVYNEVQHAAREGARFAAAGGVDLGVDDVIIQSLYESLPTSNPLDPGIMTIWVVRPVIQVSSSYPYTATWQNASTQPPWGVPMRCVYPPPPNTACSTSTSGLDSAAILQRIRDQGLVIHGDASSRPLIDDLNGERLAIVAVNYRADTILNLRFLGFFADGKVPVHAFTIMRQEIQQETVERKTGGCSAYPIALNLDMINNQGTRLRRAKEEDVFTNVALNNYATGSPGTGFAYLAWGGHTPSGQSPAYLITSMTPPGNALTTYQDRTDPAPPSPEADTQLHREDWVISSSGNGSNIAAQLTDHINKERALRVIGYTYKVGNPNLVSGFVAYQVETFLIIRITGFTSNTLSFEFVREDTSCGYDLEAQQ
ncbi:MAG: TadE/TadG family type IV pilus assembly protein [Candidatus Hadarchaeum sp.]